LQKTTKLNAMKKYPTNLNEMQWQVIEKIQNDKRQRGHSLRIIWDAIFYINVTGCQWRMLPNDFPPWQTVYYHFSNWKRNGLITQVHDALVELTRKNAGKNAMPSVGIIDSQSVKTTSVGGDDRGYDAGKKTKGRKRHLIVDTMGLIICVMVHSADIQDRDGAKLLMDKLKHDLVKLIKIFADGGYAGKLVNFANKTYNLIVEIVKRNETGFKILPKRWIVERTHSWINNSRRNSKDYEYLVESSEAMVRLAMVRVMLNRIK
jgi:putative transposase